MIRTRLQPLTAANTATTASLFAELHATSVEALGADAAALTLQRAVVGIFFTGVKLSNGVGGLCATPIKSVPEAVCCPSSAKAMPTPGKLAGRRAMDLLHDLYRPQDLRRALAIATLNALVETLWQRDGLPPGAECLAGDAFDALAIAPGARVALVGAFPPYMRELRRRGQPFQVLEMDPATLKADELLDLLAEGGSGHHFFGKSVERVSLRLQKAR